MPGDQKRKPAFPFPTVNPLSDETPEAERIPILPILIAPPIIDEVPPTEPPREPRRANLALDYTNIILAQYRDMESDIPVSHQYWKVKQGI